MFPSPEYAPPDYEMRRAFTDYLTGLGMFSDEAMSLDLLKRMADAEKSFVDLVSVWRSCWTPGKTTGPDGLVVLAMRILSIVPNSAATERLFSLMGTIHTDRRNRLDAGRVRKMALVKGDINAQWPAKERKKRHTDDCSATACASSAAVSSTTTSGESAVPQANSDASSGPGRTADSESEWDTPLTTSFSAVADELSHEAEEHDNATRSLSSQPVPGGSIGDSAAATTSNSAPVGATALHGRERLLLCNLFLKPSDPHFVQLSSYCAGFWQQAEASLDVESDLQEVLMSAPPVSSES